MFQLADGLKLVRCYEGDRYHNNLKIERKYCYSFQYQDLNIILESRFSVVSYSKYWYLPIINFGYCVELSRWDAKELCYKDLYNHIEEDALSTKKYVESKKVREILKQLCNTLVTTKTYIYTMISPILILKKLVIAQTIHFGCIRVMICPDKK